MSGRRKRAVRTAAAARRLQREQDGIRYSQEAIRGLLAAGKNKPAAAGRAGPRRADTDEAGT